MVAQSKFPSWVLSLLHAGGPPRFDEEIAVPCSSAGTTSDSTPSNWCIPTLPENKFWESAPPTQLAGAWRGPCMAAGSASCRATLLLQEAICQVVLPTPCLHSATTVVSSRHIVSKHFLFTGITVLHHPFQKLIKISIHVIIITIIIACRSRKSSITITGTIYLHGSRAIGW